MSRERITLVVEDPNWRKSRGLAKVLRKAAQAGLRASGLPGTARFTILLADDARLKDLNHVFRGKDKTTNVLSFPASASAEAGTCRTAGRKTASRSSLRSERFTLFLADAPYIGDIALAYGVTRAEARAAGKSIAEHASHLVVHGVLHLAGFDHEKDRDAEDMEKLEVKILARLGISDPYRSGFPSGRAAIRR